MAIEQVLADLTAAINANTEAQLAVAAGLGAVNSAGKPATTAPKKPDPVKDTPADEPDYVELRKEVRNYMVNNLPKKEDGLPLFKQFGAASFSKVNDEDLQALYDAAKAKVEAGAE